MNKILKAAQAKFIYIECDGKSIINDIIDMRNCLINSGLVGKWGPTLAHIASPPNFWKLAIDEDHTHWEFDSNSMQLIIEYFNGFNGRANYFLKCEWSVTLTEDNDLFEVLLNRYLKKALLQEAEIEFERYEEKRKANIINQIYDNFLNECH